MRSDGVRKWDSFNFVIGQFAMRIVLAIAPTYFIIRNCASATVVTAAAIAIYTYVWAYRQQISFTPVFWRNLLLCGLVGICLLAGWAMEDLKAIVGTAPAIYLLEVCLMVCPLVGLLSWVRNGPRPKTDKTDVRGKP